MKNTREIKSKKSFLTLLIAICLILATTTFVTNISADTTPSYYELGVCKLGIGAAPNAFARCDVNVKAPSFDYIGRWEVEFYSLLPSERIAGAFTIEIFAGDIEFCKIIAEPFDYSGDNQPEPIDRNAIEYIPEGYRHVSLYCHVEFFYWATPSSDPKIRGDTDAASLNVVFSTNSFGCTEGTQITMASGFPITKPIEDIVVGDHIASYDPINEAMTTAEVIQVFECTEDLPDNYLIFNGNLEITQNHNLYTNETWMEAENAQIGYYMLGNIPDTPETGPIVIFSKASNELDVDDPIYNLAIQPLEGNASGYWADGILVGGYN